MSTDWSDLDPQIRQLTELPQGINLRPGDPVVARKLFDKVCVATARFAPAVKLAAIEDMSIEAVHGELAVRVYRPIESADCGGTLLYLHGGGFVVGSIDSHELTCREIAHRTGVTVASAEYRLAPEHPWPAAVEDAVTAGSWALEHAGLLGGERARVGIGGDSAGGNLSAVAVQELSDQGFAAQLLIYPVTDMGREYPSHTENGHGPLLTAEAMDWFHELYVGDADRLDDPRISPLNGKLADLPPTIVVTAGFDPLRDQGDAYAEALKSAGVEVLHFSYPSLIHGFFGLGPLSKGADDAITEVCSGLRKLFAA